MPEMESRTSAPGPDRTPGVEGSEALAELALDLRWSWNHAADEIWQQLDLELWELTHNPWVVLQTVSRERVQQALADPAFREKVEGLVRARRGATAAVGWFQERHAGAPLRAVAYFSMEFMLSEALPIYSGGLGNVAGDHLKAASDLGIPVVGVGLLYQQGYFRQVIDRNGAQQSLYPYNDPGQLPIVPLRGPDGEWLRVELTLPGYSLWLRAWQVEVGRVRLYLLDSNDAANYPAHRGITSELYGGGPELRLQQEMVLGLAGWRLLRRLGVAPEVCHINEGHAALAVLERARSFMDDTKLPFEVALAATRAGNLFTTHTPVAAGFDRFAPALVEHYLGRYAADVLGVPVQRFLALGRQNPANAGEEFTMAYLALRGCGAANGVSRLHAEVSRRIFQPLYPRWPDAEVPIGHVTNGVHVPSWDSEEADELWTQSCGKERWLGDVEGLEEKIRAVPDWQVWECRSSARKSLVQFVRRQLSRQLAVSGAPPGECDAAGHIFDVNTLTLGFARRFATYKRPNLLLHDEERLLRILANAQRPVQLVLAGKAHPADAAGQAMIGQWQRFIRRPGARAHVVFLSDYDMILAERLVQGVDVWINTPRRPWEACGTSGMKVLVNGGINLSELDGWWAEAYAPEVGFALGDGHEHGDDPGWDAAEAGELYALLEQRIVPEFYRRDATGIPTAWVARVRESMARLTPRFAANRSVREYAERYYLPAAEAYLRRAADTGAPAADLIAWARVLDGGWANLRFGDAAIETRGGALDVSIHVYLNGVPADSVRVELYAEGAAGGGPDVHELQRGQQLVGAENGYVYRGTVPASRPAGDYTARIVPQREGVAVPLEVAHILWQR
ncbi:MAG TPA: alpha-glucan family phosphorylase [bacterium]